MTPEAEFRALLAAYAPLTALVQGRIVQNLVDEGMAGDYVVFSATHDPLKGLGGEVLEDEVSFSVESWAATAVRANAIADAVAGAVALAPITRQAAVTSRATGGDGDLGLDAVVMTVAWWA
jgi:hypothetical protein